MDKKNHERQVMQLFMEGFDDFPGGRVVAGESPDFLIQHGPKKNTAIEITRLPDESGNLYDQIRASINKKNNKIALYHDMYIQSYWLLMYSDDLSAYNAGNIHNKISKWVFNSRFNRLFLLDFFTGKLFIINQG